MAEFLQRLIIESHLDGWMTYILSFIERNPLSLYFSLFIVSFSVYMIRRIMFGD